MNQTACLRVWCDGPEAKRHKHRIIYTARFPIDVEPTPITTMDDVTVMRNGYSITDLQTGARWSGDASKARFTIPCKACRRNAPMSSDLYRDLRALTIARGGLPIELGDLIAWTQDRSVAL